MKIRLSSIAEQQLLDGHRFYESQAEGIGDYFLDSLMADIESLHIHAVADHFVDVNKTIAIPKGAEKIIDDLMLTRYACYLIAQNGDSRKPKIAWCPSRKIH